MGFKTVISKIHYDKKAKGLFFKLLQGCSFFYALGCNFKNKLYDIGKLKPKKVNAYVVSVGNLTTGGVGKTPVVAKIANHFLMLGEKTAIISRGYGGKLSKEINIISDGKNIFYPANLSGDEPRWLAENTNAVVITSKNRYKGAKFAIEKFGVTKIILDDGFQHRKIYRDLDIVLVDSEKGFGNENLLPAGPLREGPESFNRVNKFIIVSKNTDHSRAEKYAKVMGKKLKKDAIVCYIEPECIYNILDKQESLNKEDKVLAFSAIGQPQQFYSFLKDYNVVKTIDFDDHHNYSDSDIQKLQKICTDLDIRTLITTEKDAAKLASKGFYLKVFALKLRTSLDVESLLKNE